MAARSPGARPVARPYPWALLGVAFLLWLPLAARAAAPRDLDATRLGETHRALHERGAYPQADSVAALQVRRLRAIAPGSPELAAALADAAGYASALGGAARAESLYREALAVRGAAPTDTTMLALRIELAGVVADQGRHTDAEALVREVLDARRAAHGDDHAATLDALRVLGTIVRRAGEADLADSLLRRALDGFRRVEGPDGPGVIATETWVGALLRDRGFYDESEAMLLHVLEARQRRHGREHPIVADALQELAWTIQRRGDYDRSVGLAKESLAIRRRWFGASHPLTLTALAEVANIQTGFGQVGRGEALAEAEATFREAAALWRARHGERDPRYGTLLSDWGWNLVLQWKLVEADSILERALAIRRLAVGDDDRSISLILNRQARLAYGLGDYAKAEKLLVELLDRYAREWGTTTQEYQSILEGLGIMRAAQQDFAGAEAHTTRAARLYEMLRIRAGSGHVRASYWYSPYERLAGMLMELNREAEAWAAVERMQGLTLADMLLATGGRELNPAERAAEDSLASVLTDLENRLNRAQAAAAADPAARDRARELSRRLLATESAWNRLRGEIAERLPATEGRIYSVERIQAALDSSTAIVGWLDAEFGFERVYAWGYVIRHEGPVRWVRLGMPLSPDSTANYSARKLREWLVEPARSTLAIPPVVRPHPEARKLWDDRIAPLLPQLEGVTRLVVLPSRAVNGVPAGAFVDPEGRHLVDRFAVTYASSATVYAWLCERPDRTRPVRRGLLVGDPPYRAEHLAEMKKASAVVANAAPAAVDAETFKAALRGERDAIGKLPRLRWSRREVDAVAKALPRADRLVGPDAAETAFRGARRKRLVEYDVLHFATHAIVSRQRPEASALVLSQVATPAPGDTAALDGLVTGAEVMRDWDLGAELVTLSACETGLGYQTSEGSFGLAQAFLQSGARSVLVSLWPVDDEATTLLMSRFYQLWLGDAGYTKARALQEAKRWLRDRRARDGARRFSHPWFWSGFVLLGEAD